jgi:hypothetical protein
VESWLQFFFMTGGLLLLGLLIMIRGYFDDRQWQRQKEAEEAARRAVAE